jgi:hypothetical protein
MSFSEEELEHDIETMTAEDFEAKYSGVDLEEDKTEYDKNKKETQKTFPNVKYFTKKGHPDWAKHDSMKEEVELEEKLAGGEKSRQAYAARYTPTGKKKKPEVGKKAEQVDELSSKTYGDYIGSASASKSALAHDIGKINQIAATTGTTPRDREDRNALNRKHAQRSIGIGRAVKNLTKGGIDFEEEVELEEKLAGGEKSRQAYAARYTPTGKKKKPEVEKEVEEECASCEERKLSPAQLRIAKLAGNPNEIDAEDLKKLREQETERVTPDTLASRNKAVERSIMEIMATNRDLRQEAKIAAFQKNAKSQEKE